MILIIAEKPSMGSSIANAIEGTKKRHDGYIEVGQYCITWCFGHLIESVNPEVYNPQYKKWSLDTLPIIPHKWQYQERGDTKKQLNIIRNLINKATTIIHAGDPDREGQLLVDELFHYFNLSLDVIKKIKRLIIADLTPQAIKISLNNLKDNINYNALSTSALARARSDWLYGINLSRAATLIGQKQGYNGVLSVGRVQTPLLGLVVRRDLSILNFVSQEHYGLVAEICEYIEQDSFFANWQFDKEGEGTNENGLLVDKKYIESIKKSLDGKNAIVKQYSEKEEKEHQPLCYSLSDLQYDAALLYNMSAQDVITIAQTLYEKYQLTTYPRSDTGYLTTLQYKNRKNIINVITKNNKDIANLIKKEEFDIDIKSKTWNDKQVEVHHAIIPTTKEYNIESLPDREQKIYNLIAKRYLMQFFPSAIYKSVEAKIIIDRESFISKEKFNINLGWKIINSKNNEDNSKKDTKIPIMTKGQILPVKSLNIEVKNTKPDNHFTNASIIKAMTGISRFVKNKDLKKILRDTDGIGTEATRAQILELLFKRNFLTKKGKNIVATQVGINFINSLPEQITLPDITAYWEMQLEKMSKDKSLYVEFMDNIYKNLTLLKEAIINNSNKFSTLQN